MYKRQQLLQHGFIAVDDPRRREADGKPRALRMVLDLVADGVDAAVDRSGGAEIDDGGQALVLRRCLLYTSGLKRDAAINAVTLAVEQETATDTLTVVLPDRTIDFTPEITNVALNPDEAADAAMNYGRDGGPITALLTYERAKKTRQDISLESGTNLDTCLLYTSRCVYETG